MEFALKSVNIYSLSSTDTGSLYLIIVLTDKIRFELLSRLKQSFLTLFKTARLKSFFHAYSTRFKPVRNAFFKCLFKNIRGIKYFNFFYGGRNSKVLLIDRSNFGLKKWINNPLFIQVLKTLVFFKEVSVLFNGFANAFLFEFFWQLKRFLTGIFKPFL